MDYYKDFIRDITKGKQPIGPKIAASQPVVDLVGPKRTTGKINTGFDCLVSCFNLFLVLSIDEDSDCDVVMKSTDSPAFAKTLQKTTDGLPSRTESI